MARKKSPTTDPPAGSGAATEDVIRPGVVLPEAGACKSVLPEAGKNYVVLARKYRPETFADLIGQEAMVRTLTNAFAGDRIAQAYMLTGVRGVGKTTTARILARAFNYEKPGEPGRPTIALDGYGVHCRDIIQGRHPDVIEMDAASHTGVDDIRELIGNAQLRPILARAKVFIVDEVHMLSKNAFNALLKTLEEPPEHVRFIFATTEIRKVPVTVLSRCQRFDLRRVEVTQLVAHLQGIAGKEGATAEAPALALIARAAEGSVRDALSMLDQAIALSHGRVEIDVVRAMLGLADRGRIFDLLELVLRGDVAGALAAFAALNADGAEPQQVLGELAEAVHIATRSKVAGAGGDGLTPDEAQRGAALAETVSVALLSRAWQMLLKAIEETARAPHPAAAAEMALIRLAFVADLPPPDEILRRLGGEPRREPGSGERARPAASQDAPREASEARGATIAATSAPPLRAWTDVVALAGRHREAMLKVHLEEHVRLVRFEPGRIEFRPLAGAPTSLAAELGEKLSRWTGQRWVIAVSNEAGAPPLREIEDQERAAEKARLLAHPAVEGLRAAFPDAEFRAIRPLPRPAIEAPAEPGGLDIDDDDTDSATG